MLLPLPWIMPYCKSVLCASMTKVSAEQLPVVLGLRDVIVSAGTRDNPSHGHSTTMMYWPLGNGATQFCHQKHPLRVNVEMKGAWGPPHCSEAKASFYAKYQSLLTMYVGHSCNFVANPVPQLLDSSDPFLTLHAGKGMVDLLRSTDGHFYPMLCRQWCLVYTLPSCQAVSAL